jgi:hypothetical protein
MCIRVLFLMALLLAGGLPAAEKAETLAEIGARLGRETSEAYRACPFSPLSRDFTARYVRDPEAASEPGETVIDNTWRIIVSGDAESLPARMGDLLRVFLEKAMDVSVAVESPHPEAEKIILLEAENGGDPAVPESYTITVAVDRIRIAGRDVAGLRDGVVRLCDRMGFRQAPFLRQGEDIYRPRLRVRLGSTPFQGSWPELVFLGCNTVFAGGGSLYALSESEAIPELKSRRVPGLIERNAAQVAEASSWGLRTCAFLNTRQKFPEDDPVFQAHPEIRGTRTWRADGEFVLCTEAPLVQQYLSGSVEALFRAMPDLDGLVIIIGGEGFYHCFMRPYGAEKGHTACPRCEALGPDRVVANLCNLLAEAARKVNPEAEVLAWPYSAEHVWSSDRAQSGFIAHLKPGTGILTEMEKDEYITKPRGVRKHLWDYSIDLIGPGDRAREQIAACREAGIPIFMKSEPELGFEAPRLPQIPCMDRWVDRAEALASCGADGAFIFPAFRPCYGTSAAEIPKHVFWSEAPEKEALLMRLAARIAGSAAAPHLRKAWAAVSEAIRYSPELPPYYTGPYYLGPAHPMIANPDHEVPRVFYGRYLFHAEIMDAEGLKKEPTFFRKPRGDTETFGALYRDMEKTLAVAAAEMEKARPLVPDRRRMLFDAEDSPVQWFYRTARTHANFHESCILRDKLLAMADKETLTAEESGKALEMLQRWREVLIDERENTRAALPLVEKDMRLDCYYGGDHTFPHTADMIRAKSELLDYEIYDFLPDLEKRVLN